MKFVLYFIALPMLISTIAASVCDGSSWWFWVFYAIVRLWYVTIDCFASLPRDISAKSSYFSYLYAVKIIADSNEKLHWCTAAIPTGDSGFRIYRHTMNMYIAVDLSPEYNSIY